MIVGLFRAAVPDLRLTNTVLLAADDRVMQRWIVHGTHTGADLFGVPAQGAELTLSGINEFRIADGRIAERWGTMDVLGMLQQLGVAPDPGHSPPPGDSDETETRQADDYTMSDVEQELGRRSHDEFMVGGDEDVVDEVYAHDAVIFGRHIPPDQRRGTEGFKDYGRAMRTAFPDIAIVHDSFVTEGDSRRSAGRSTGRTEGRSSALRRRARRSRSRATTSCGSGTARSSRPGSSRT